MQMMTVFMASRRVVVVKVPRRQALLHRCISAQMLPPMVMVCHRTLCPSSPPGSSRGGMQRQLEADK
jgi:hypothetical protein